MKTGKISTNKNFGSYEDESVRGALARKGLTRAPGTTVKMFPYKNRDNSYRTGLDPDALYIKEMPKEEAKLEIARVKGYLEMAKEFFPGTDLGPRSPFWSEMVKKWGDPNVAPIASMVDGDNFYDFSDPQALITYCYLRVHPNVAPSGSALMSGKYSRSKYYVNDFDVEMTIKHKIKSEIAKAVQKLSSMSPTKSKMVARQLGISANSHSTEESIFVMLYDFINESSDTKKEHNVKLFNTFANMKDENLKLRDLVKQSITYSVLRKNKGGIYRGDNKVAENEEEYIELISSPKNQEELAALEVELKSKLSVKEQ